MLWSHRTKRFTFLACVALTTAVAAEAIAEYHIDVPAFDANNRIGYVPKPSQSSSFFNRQRWAFNELGMGTIRPFATDERPDILLIGDSIVFGALPGNQNDRLGPTLERMTGDRVWPISAGSWALQNELEWLREHPGVVGRVDRILFVVNSEDFGDPSSWSSEFTHPRRRPWPALWFAARRALFADENPPPVAPEFQVKSRDTAADWAGFVRQAGKPITVIAYPNVGDRSGRCEWVPPEYAAHGEWVCLSARKPWSSQFYADNIHPNLAGTQALATVIGRSVKN